MNPGPASAPGRGYRLLACLAILLSFPAAAAEAHRVRALLVGVSTYPSLPAELQLQDAPANDVQLFSNYLRKRGVAHADITILSDKVPGAAAPRRREILAGLSRLAAQARPGDTVVLMFSGHGSQQPTRQGARVEPDGLDQIFLPQDAGSWDGAPRQVQNSITDDEIGSALEQLRARGAFVWAIFDTCHAGTLTSAVLGSGRAHLMAPERLGVSAAALGAAPEYSPTLRSTSTDMLRPRFESTASAAGYVAFFASQREQITGQVQIRLDRASRSYGRFTWTLVQALEAQPGASYRQIMEMVLMSYRGMGVFETTPGYEGTALDARVLGNTADPVVQWPVNAEDGQLHLEAGLLQGISAGSVLSLVSGPAAPANETLGYVRVQRAAPVDSILLPIEYNRTPALRLASGGTKGNTSTLFYARPVDMADLALRVARPRKGTRCESPGALLEEALATLRRRAPSLPRIQWAQAGEDTEVLLCQRHGKLIFLEGRGVKGHRHDGLAGTAPLTGGMTSAALADAIAETLQRIYAVQNIYRIAADHASTNRLVEAAVQLCRGAGSSTTPCARAETVSTTARPVVHRGDRVQITLRNSAWSPVHVTVLHIDANFRIHTLFPDPAIPQEQARIPARSEAIFIPVLPNADPAGLERVLVIAVAEEPRGKSQAGILKLITRTVRGMGSRNSGQEGFDRPVGFTGFGWMVAPDQTSAGLPHAR
jgi:hypothetical protein